MPRGALKNFYNAAVVCRDIRDGQRVCIVGSRAHSASGNWVRFLGLFISTFAKDVQIHCFDAHEVSGLETMNGNVRIRAHECLYDGDGSEYDILIDDVYVPLVGVGAQRYRTPIQTMKRDAPDQVDGIDSVRFLHDKEHRVFIPPLPQSSSVCKCDRCTVEGMFSMDKRDTLVRYGDIVEPSYCRVRFPEILSLSDLWTNFRAVDHLEIVTPVQRRATIALARIEPAMEVDSIALMDGRPFVVGNDKDHTTFTGKTFVFHGVDPKDFPYIVTRANKSSRFTTYAGHADYAVVRDALAYSFYRASTYLLVQSFMPHGWMPTGKKYLTWIELKRIEYPRPKKKIEQEKMRRQHRGLVRAKPMAKLRCKGVFVRTYDPGEGLERFGGGAGFYASGYDTEQTFCHWCYKFACRCGQTELVDCGVCGPGICMHKKGFKCDCGIRDHHQHLGTRQIEVANALGAGVGLCVKYPHYKQAATRDLPVYHDDAIRMDGSLDLGQV